MSTLGVGVLYSPALLTFLSEHTDSYDYVEIIPDMFWTDDGPGANPRYVELGTWIDELDRVAERVPLVSHSTGLSLGTAAGFDSEPVRHLAQWHQRYGFAWHSDHLSFSQVGVPVPGGVDGEHGGIHGDVHNTALALPIPYDEEMLHLVAGRIDSVLATVPLPFLVENNVYYVDVPEQDMSEPEFLNRLCELTGCGLLLDLHNLYTNARNHNFDPFTFLDALDCDRVQEIHVAGGSELGGMWTDSHAGPVAEPVWDLLDATVPRTTRLRGITFEFHDSYFPLLGDSGVAEQLARIRSAGSRVPS